MRYPLARRCFLIGSGLLVVDAAALAAGLATPAQTEGPFFPRRIPADSDFDLTLYGQGRAEGAVIDVAGRVLDLKGAPIGGAEVEIWQADDRGIYANVGAEGGDPDFQGYGIVRAAADGIYRFRTILPGLYTGRTRHIHFRIRPGAGRSLTTQMYFPGEAGNARDGVLRRLDPAAQAAVIAAVEPGDPPRYRFDIVLDRA